MYFHRYQHLFTGKYGLVDGHHRNLWLTLSSEDDAHTIKKVFSSKLSLVVVDLSAFANFSLEDINSHTCMEWQVPPASNPTLTSPDDVHVEFKSTVSTYSQLANLVQQKTTFLLTDDRIVELQDQILLFAHILTLFRVSKFDSIHISKEYIDQLQKIFQVELNIDVIEKQVCLMSKLHIGKLFVPLLVLDTIGRTQYE